MKKELIAALNALGIVTTEHTTTKNGITYTGISLGTGELRPTLYYENALAEYQNGKTVAEIAAEWKTIYDNSQNQIVDTKQFGNWDWAKSRVRMCVQKAGETGLATKPFLDLDIYFRVDVNINGDEGTFKITEKLMAEYGITVEELYRTAIRNAKDTYTIRNMVDVIGVNLEEFNINPNTLIPTYVVANKEGQYGAAAITMEPVMELVANKLEDDLWIIPSSIHELIIIPESYFLPEQINSMIREVNRDVVSATEVLSDHAYIYKRGAGVTM